MPIACKSSWRSWVRDQIHTSAVTRAIAVATLDLQLTKPPGNSDTKFYIHYNHNCMFKYVCHLWCSWLQVTEHLTNLVYTISAFFFLLQYFYASIEIYCFKTDSAVWLLCQLPLTITSWSWDGWTFLTSNPLHTSLI